MLLFFDQIWGWGIKETLGKRKAWEGWSVVVVIAGFFFLIVFQTQKKSFGCSFNWNSFAIRTAWLFFILD